MNLFKLITKTGRQSLVREAARGYLKVDKIAELLAKYVSDLLAQSCAGIPEERMVRVCGNCRDGAALFAAISDAVSDKVVTHEEVSEICMLASRLTGNVVTQERLDAIVENIVARVP